MGSDYNNPLVAYPIRLLRSMDFVSDYYIKYKVAMMMTAEELKRLREICEKARPLPWEEVWKEIPGTIGYRISDFGNVQSKLRRGNYKVKETSDWRNLKRGRSTTGYPTVCLPLKKDGSYQHILIHRLVMQIFVGPCPAGYEVAHLNGIRDDARLVNLKYCTPKENNSHKQIHGTNGEGENNSVAIFQGWQVEEIRYLASKGVSRNKIAGLFDVQIKSITEILNKNSYKENQARTAIPALLDEIDFSMNESKRYYDVCILLREENTRLRTVLKYYADYYADDESRHR